MNRSKKYSIATTKIRKRPREEKEIVERAKSARTSTITHTESKKLLEVGAGVPIVAKGKAPKERNL